MANIVLVDDHQLILESFPLLIEKISDHKVLNTFHNPEEAHVFIKKNASDIDLLITDMRMNEMSGVKLIAIVKKTIPDLKILVISQFDLKELVIRSVQLGALGYCLKDIPAKEFGYAIDKVLKGEMYLCNKALKVIVNAQKEQELNVHLTAREKEVLFNIAIGKTSKEIAILLNVETATISFYRRNIMQKIEAKNVADLTRKAFEIGLLDIG